MELLTAITVGFLFAVGIFQMLRRNIIRSAIGLVILANAVNLFLLSTGAYDGMAAAYTGAPAEATAGEGDDLTARLAVMVATEVLEAIAPPAG